MFGTEEDMMTASQAAHAATGLQMPPALPLPVLHVREDADVGYWSVTTLDDSGRLADRSPVRVLGWTAHQPLQVSMSGSAGWIVRADGGPLAVGARGHVRLPVDLRRRLGLTCGDRVLVTTRPGQGALVVYPLPIVARLLESCEASVGPGLQHA
ncbi:AbrB/MazE/SpoVT family DNA-binding domain-containing protein [Dactylosporangium sp. NPDC000244]|uniref:AbrB/MazE/SpoVT family DNA-binding domain-containing protein n=1 Tax=Dactylosporangium sp. NPDC000244 TaxID=3154365 RepID=UPI00331BE5F0